MIISVSLAAAYNIDPANYATQLQLRSHMETNSTCMLSDSAPTSYIINQTADQVRASGNMFDD